MLANRSAKGGRFTEAGFYHRFIVGSYITYVYVTRSVIGDGIALLSARSFIIISAPWLPLRA